MNKQYYLRIYNLRKSWPGVLAIVLFIPATAGLLWVAVRLQVHAPTWLAMGGLLLYLAGAMYGLFRLMKYLTVEEVVIALDETAFRLTHLRTGLQQVVPWTEMVAYRRHLYQDQDVLRIQTSTGQRLRVGTMPMYTGTQNAAELMAAFEQVVSQRPWIQKRLLTFL